jgi:MSHA biogenesis protein MshK
VSEVLGAVLAAALVAVAGVAGAQQGLGDPTRPTSLAEPEPVAKAAAQAGPRWRLQSTLVAESRRLAVINGRTVAQGERVDGATVREVRQEGVTLDVDGRQVELRILPGSIGVKRSGG